MRESEQELRERIERSRERMGETVEEIGVRVNPDRVQRELKARARSEVDDFKENVKQKARSTMRDLEHEAEARGRGVWRTIKDNPIPATMVGAGLAWLVANSKSDSEEAVRARTTTYGWSEPYPPAYPRAHEYGYETRPRGDIGPRSGVRAEGELRTQTYSEDESGGAKERAAEMADEAREKGAEVADRARHAAEEGMETARDKASELSHRASEWTDRMEHRAMRAERRVEHAVQDNPLAAGAMAAALGFAAGLMVPETQREHELMGHTRDRVFDRAKDSAQEAAGKARETARDTAGEMASSAARRAVDETFPEVGGDEDRAMTEPGRG